MDEANVYQTWPELARRHGEFYSIGMPGLGSDLKGTTYIIQDPKEMMKLLRREGIYPTSIVQKQWAMVRFLEENSFGRVAEILGHGPEWKRVRSFLQTDLLSPQSANRYLPGIIRAAKYASKGAASAENVKHYLNEASFDMFSMILMGDLPRITDPSVESHPEDVVFCRSVANALSTNSKLNRDIVSMLMNRVGLKSSTYNFFADSWKEALDIARVKIDAVLEKRAKGELTEEEASSYLNQAMDRQMEQAETTDDPVTVDEVKSIAVALLTASVDTTSGLIAWNLVHIAQNPDVQERIRQELMTATGGTGKLTPEAVSPKAVPYLHAAIRESHRLTSPSPLSAFRIMPGDVQVHGVTLPENSMVVFDGYSKGVDPTLVEDADTFKPSRFLPEAVESRKGKPSEVIDHPLFSGPFSQGARRCPGSRVSRNEVNILLSQLILDYDITCEVDSWKDVKVCLDTVYAPVMPKIEFTPRA
jgi:cytochrome P450